MDGQALSENSNTMAIAWQADVRGGRQARLIVAEAGLTIREKV
jgi:hypothetical protein